MPLRRAAVLLALLAPCIACDQTTKNLAVSHLRGASPIELSFLRLTYAENPGAFLNLGARLPESARITLFTLGVSIALLTLGAYVLRRRLAPAPFLAFGLVLAGGLGNLLDRLARPGGRVVDFAQLGVSLPWGRLQTGIFNIADLYIVAGALIMGWLAFSQRRDRPIRT